MTQKLSFCGCADDADYENVPVPDWGEVGTIRFFNGKEMDAVWIGDCWWVPEIDMVFKTDPKTHVVSLQE